jgi:DNA-binding NarL/FixJ family response regulator
MGDQPIQVVLADATVARRSLEALLAATAGMQVVAVPAAALLFRTLCEVRPDVVVVDDDLLGHYSRLPKSHVTRLIVIGVDDEPGFRARATRAGAEAWIPKQLADRLLPDAIRRSAPAGD